MKWIKEGVEGLPQTIKQVYRKPFYFFLSLIIAIALIVINIGVINYKFYLTNPGLKPAVAVFFGSFQTIPVHSVILLFVSAILSGVLVSFLTFHIKKIRKMNGAYASGTFGGIIGVVAPACSSCGIGLAAVLGLTGLIGTLPFEGTELAALGISLLTLSIINLAAKITIKTCEIKKVPLGE